MLSTKEIGKKSSVCFWLKRQKYFKCHCLSHITHLWLQSILNCFWTQCEVRVQFHLSAGKYPVSSTPFTEDSFSQCVSLTTMLELYLNAHVGSLLGSSFYYILQGIFSVCLRGASCCFYYHSSVGHLVIPLALWCFVSVFRSCLPSLIRDFCGSK